MKTIKKINSSNRVGEININTYGTPMKIIRYNLAADITVEFQDEYKLQVVTTYRNFKTGVITNLYDRTIYGVGYVGVGKYLPSTEEGAEDKVYHIWRGMFKRCYAKSEKIRGVGYFGCTVCKEWHNYQNFAKWYEDNFYDINEGRMHIDKDIILKENKIYSPEYCMFVPQRINMIFMTKTKSRNKDLPNAINRCVGGFTAMYNGKSLGVFKTLEDAIEIHDAKKRIHIKQVAKEYKNRLPIRVYDALLNW